MPGFVGAGVAPDDGEFHLLERDEHGRPIGMKMIHPTDVVIVRSDADNHVIGYLVRDYDACQGS